MKKNKHSQFKKLSANLPDAPPNTTSDHLLVFKRLINQSTELGEEIGQVITRLRQVTAPEGEPFVFTTSLSDNKRLLELSFLDCDDVIAFKKAKFVGYLDDYAITGGKYINGTEKSSIITTKSPDNPSKVCVFELFRHDTKLTPHVTDGKIYFTLDIKMIGNIGEMQSSSQDSQTKDPKYIQKLEESLAKEVKQAVEYALQTRQTLGVVFFRFGAKLQAHEPETWDSNAT